VEVVVATNGMGHNHAAEAPKQRLAAGKLGLSAGNFPQNIFDFFAFGACLWHWG
jgi:hypothetical protein